MLLKVRAFLAIYFLSSVCGLKENVLFNIPELDENQLKWPQQKIETIEYLLSILTEVGNVTLVGWQRIYEIDGSLKEIRTIELTILTEARSEQSLSLEDVAVYREAVVLEEVLNEADILTGTAWSGSFHQWDRDGSSFRFLEIQPNSVKVYDNLNKFMDWKRKATVTDSKKSYKLIDTLLKKLERQSPLAVAVLYWDVDGKLTVQNMVPIHIVTVHSAEEANTGQLESVVYAVAKATAYNKLHVTNYMTKKFPGYVWIATSNVDDSWLNYEVHIQVGYARNILYRSIINIYGVKK